MKHEKTCTAQFEADVEHDEWSEKGRRGFEHHLPHWYSHVGVGVDTMTVEVHSDTVLLDVVVGGGELCNIGLVTLGISVVGRHTVDLVVQ